MPLTTKNKRTITIGALCLAGAAGITWLCHTPDTRPAIGIIQAASHPALDAAREGFIEEMKRALGASVAFIENNAQNDINQAQAIATQYAHNDRVTLIFCLATSAVQAALNAETTKPIVFTAVTDSSLLTKRRADTVLTGCCDMIDTDAYCTKAMYLLPYVHTCGLLYNPADPGAVLMVQQMEKHLLKKGKVVEHFGITSETELPLTVTLACEKTDAILCPIDTTVSMGSDIVARQAWNRHTPVINCDKTVLKPGITASFGINYRELGASSAQQALAVLASAPGTPAPAIVTCSPGTLIMQPETVRHLGNKVAPNP